MNVQKLNTSEVANTETVMADNEYLDPPLPQDILNVFSVADLSSHSSSDSAGYKRVWLKVKVIRCYILYVGEYPDTYSRTLSISLNRREISSNMAVTVAIFPKIYANAIIRHEQKKEILSHATSVINK